MPAKTQFARKVDPVVTRVIGGYATFFTKPEVVREVLKSAPNLGNVINNADKHAPGWGLGDVLRGAILERISQELTKKVYSNKFKTQLRQYENYAVGHGARRWQRLDVMSLSELQVCVNYRRAHVAGEQAVINAYERIIDEMKKSGQSKVGGVLK